MLTYSISKNNYRTKGCRVFNPLLVVVLRAKHIRAIIAALSVPSAVLSLIVTTPIQITNNW